MLFQPTSPHLVYTTAQVVEIEPGMRVRIDRNAHAFGFRHRAVRAGQVKPIGMRVEFQMAAACARFPNDAHEIDVIRIALADQPSGDMSEARETT